MITFDEYVRMQTGCEVDHINDFKTNFETFPRSGPDRRIPLALLRASLCDALGDTAVVDSLLALTVRDGCVIAPVTCLISGIVNFVVVNLGITFIISVTGVKRWGLTRTLRLRHTQAWLLSTPDSQIRSFTQHTAFHFTSHFTPTCFPHHLAQAHAFRLVCFVCSIVFACWCGI